MFPRMPSISRYIRLRRLIQTNPRQLPLHLRLLSLKHKIIVQIFHIYLVQGKSFFLFCFLLRLFSISRLPKIKSSKSTRVLEISLKQAQDAFGHCLEVRIWSRFRVYFHLLSRACKIVVFLVCSYLVQTWGCTSFHYWCGADLAAWYT